MGMDMDVGVGAGAGGGGDMRTETGGEVEWSCVSFYLNYLYYTVFIVVLNGIYTAIRSLPRPNSAYNMRFGAEWIRFFARCFRFQIDIRSRELLDREGSYIVVANHQSVFDVVTIGHFWPTNCVIMAKNSLFWLTGPFGIAIWLAGTVFVKRNNRQSAIQALDRAVERITQDNLRVWVYPEGTRNMEQEMLPFKKGAFHMAAQANIPIIPVVISRYSNWLNFSQKQMVSPNGRRIIVEVLDPIFPDGQQPDHIHKMMEVCRTRMVSTLDKITLELEQQAQTQKKVQ